MALTEVGTNVLSGVRYDNTITLPITDSTTITKNDFVELSSGKLITSITTLSSSLVGLATTTKTQGVESTTGIVEKIGIVTEGIVRVKGLVEGSGGTYTSALAVGDTVSFHYDATSGYGQFVVNSSSSPIGRVIEGSVASSGDTDDQWDYVLVQLDFERGGSAGIVDNSITAVKTTTEIPASINATKQWLDVGSFAITSTETTAVVDWSATLTATTGVKVFVQALTATATIPIPGTMTATGFTITGANSQTGNWFAWIPNSSK
jgi:hypothetical protein